MKILLFGKNGQVGWELQRSLASLGEVIALDRHSTDFCGDLTHLQGLAATVQALRPDVIVNAAAYTAVDQAESQPDVARTINAAAPGVLAQEARKLGAWLVHYSTDYVFDGSGSQPWQESQAPAPLNVYGQTKLEGEQLIVQHCPQHLIFRTSWVYAAHGKNFAKTILRKAQARESLSVIDNQWGAPTSAELLADVTAHAICQVRRRPRPHFNEAGIYHLAAHGEASWFSYAKHVLGHAGYAQAAIELIAKEMVAVAAPALTMPARRPHNSRLNTAKLQTTFGLQMPPWQQGVNRMLDELLSNQNP